MGLKRIRQIYGIPYGVKVYILMHLVADIKLLHLFRIEFQMCVMNCLFAYIMVHNLEFNFLKIFNQSGDRNKSRRERKDRRQSQ